MRQVVTMKLMTNRATRRRDLRKSTIIGEEKWMVVPMGQVVTIKLLTDPAPRRQDLRKSSIAVEEKWMMAPMKMMVDLQRMHLLLMMMPHCEGNNLFFSPTWVARVTTRRILLVLVL
jgi:hypothetical protein